MRNKKQNLLIENLFSLKFILSSIVTAYLFYLYTDYWGFTKIGFILSFAMFLGIIAVSLKNFSLAVSLTLYSVFLSARVPRNLIFVMTDLRVEQKINFYSMINSKFFGFSFAQWLFLSLGIIASTKFIIQNGKLFIFKNTKYLLLSILGVMILMYVATLLDTIFFRDVFNIRVFISDHKFFIILISSLIAGNYFVNINRNPAFTLTRDLIFIGLASGFKTIFFIINDYVNQNLNIDFSSQPYLLLPLFLTMIYVLSKKLKSFQVVLISLVIFLGGFSISRGDILLFVIDLMMLIFLIISSFGNYKFNNKTMKIIIIILIIIILFPPILLYHLNKSAFIFLVYKINFFTKEIWTGNISESPSIRIFEFKNIFKEASDLIYPLFIGKGFGGYFTYKNYPSDFKFSLFDYSLKELSQQIYFRPHTFINFYLLKGGIVLLLFYLSIIVYMLILGIKSLNSTDIFSKFIAIFTFLYFLFALNMFWRPIYIFFFGIITNVLFKINYENLFRESNQNEK